MIYPHKGGFREAGTIGRAYLLNNPLQCVRKENASGSLPAQYSMVRVDAENVITEVVKEAEEELGCGENSFELEMMPYEIKTLRVIFQ